MRFQSRRVDLAAGLLGLVMLASPGSAMAQGEDTGGKAAGAVEAACAAGDGEACLALGEGLFLSGGDVAGALGLFAQACELDVARACFRLGAELEFPDFGAPDAEGALAAYTRACELDLEDGCDRAGIEPAVEAPKDRGEKAWNEEEEEEVTMERGVAGPASPAGEERRELLLLLLGGSPPDPPPAAAATAVAVAANVPSTICQPWAMASSKMRAA
jgi:hypothetical protein